MKLIFISLFLIPALCLSQNDTELDKKALNEDKEENLSKRNKAIIDSYEITRVGIPLIAIGSILNNNDRDFRTFRNNHIPNFRYRYDDYLQYSPAAIMLGLKAGGVKSRSSWGRMLTADALSVAIMAGTVNSIKYTAKKQRPDESARNSFPSGHTATAFMCATMLHKEYGETVSPLYSVGGYTLATATAISRVLNNKHWLSDVIAGAGLGIVSTNLGYYITDKVFGEKGIEREAIRHTYEPDETNFFSLSIGTGYNLPGQYFSLSKDINVKSSEGFTSYLSANFHFNRQWAVKYKYRLYQSNVTRHQTFEAPIGTLNLYTTDKISSTSYLFGGSYGRYVYKGIRIGGEIMGGVSKVSIMSTDMGKDSFGLIEGSPLSLGSIDMSLFVDHLSDSFTSLKIFLNYNYSFGKAYFKVRDNAKEFTTSNVNIGTLSIGAEVSGVFRFQKRKKNRVRL